jgi:hypothetical protein
MFFAATSDAPLLRRVVAMLSILAPLVNITHAWDSPGMASLPLYAIQPYVVFGVPLAWLARCHLRRTYQ